MHPSLKFKHNYVYIEVSYTSMINLETNLEKEMEYYSLTIAIFLDLQLQMLKTKWQHYADQQKMCFHSSSSLNQVK